MNLDPDTSKRTEELRSEIDNTRQRMDQTIDALAGRFKSRHLLDEAIGYFRSNSATTSESASRIKDTVVNSASSAANSIVNTVKQNPLPVALIGAGVAWMIYQSTRSCSSSSDPDEDLYEYRVRGRYEEDFDGEPGYELSGGGYGSAETQEELSPDFSAADSSSTGSSGSGVGGKLGEMKSRLADKASSAKDQIQQKVGQLGDTVRDRAQAMRERAGELGSRVQERSREVYESGRERVVQTTTQHPIEVGLGLLLLGVVAGLALPTPRKVNQVVGPRADRLRERAREAGKNLVDRGSNVVRAAATAVRDEAQTQGLTPGALKEKAAAVAGHAKDAATESARQEGMVGSEIGNRERSESAASI
jgi:hypothetical protein